MERELEVIFAREKIRLTHPRKVIFKILHESDAPLSASMIAKQCQSIDRVSVYRSLDLFVRLGIARSVPIGWKQRYELTDPFRSHHHHLSCTSCGQLIDVRSEKFETMINNLVTEYGFLPTDHTFEVRGLCKDCC